MGKIEVVKVLANSIQLILARSGSARASTRKQAMVRWLWLGLGILYLAISASGCLPVLVGVAAFPLTAMALDLTHPMVDETASYMVWAKEETAEATKICDANGAPADSDCLSYELQGK
jgi:hypothetical protein